MWKLLLVLGLLTPSLALAISPRLQETINEIRQVSNAFGFDFYKALSVAEKESNKSQKAVGKNKEIGLYQFKLRTWNYLKKLSGMKALNINSSFDQTLLFVWAVQHGFSRYWSSY